jgi:hypothetical protein
LEADKFKDYEMGTIAGAMVQVIMPFGQYNPSELINLGSNRWTIRSKIGIAHRIDDWIMEFRTGLWIFTENTDFVDGFNLEQQPLFVANFHLIRNLSKSAWIAFDVGYGRGGRTIVEGELKDNRISTFRFGITFAYTVSPQHVLRLALTSGKRIERGADFDAAALLYQYFWN